MNKEVFLLSSIFFLQIAISGQTQQIVFSKTFDSESSITLNSIISTFDNCYIITGYTGESGLLIKIDSAGNIIKNRTITPNDDIPDFRLRSIISTKDSSYMLVGESIDWRTFEGDAHCLKVNSDLDVIWHKKFNTTTLGPDGKHTNAYYIQQTTDFGYIVLGDIWNTGGQYYIMVAKFDPNGNIEWCEELGNRRPYWGSIIKETQDGGYILISYSAKDQRSYSVLTRLNSNGNIQWSKKYQLLNPIFSYHGNESDIEITESGYLCCIEGRLTLTDFNGNILSCKRLGPGDSTTQSFLINNIIKSGDRKYIIGAMKYNGSNYQVVKTDLSGNTVWTKNLLLGVSDMELTFDHGIIALGGIGMIKIDSLGNGLYCVESTNLTLQDDTIISSGFNIPNSYGAIESWITSTYDSLDIQALSGCVELIGTSIETAQNEHNILFYPNPVQDILYMRYNFDSGDNGFFEIYDITGKLVLFEEINTSYNNAEINCNTLSSGTYFYRLYNNSRLIKSDILIILK